MQVPHGSRDVLNAFYSKTAFIISVIWAVIVTFAYFREHPLSFPLSGWSMPHFAALLPMLPGIAAFALTFLAGHGLLIAAKCQPESFATALAALPAGLLISAASGFILGSTYGFNRPTLFVTIILLCFFACISLKETKWRDIYSILLSSFKPYQSKIAIVIILGIAFLDIPGVTAPATTYDDLFYHLTIPRLYIENGKLNFLTDFSPANRPQSLHLLYTWLMMIGNDVSIRTFNWLLKIAIAFTLFFPATKHLGPTAGICAAFAWTMQPEVSWLSRTAYTDLMIVYLTLAALFVTWNTSVCTIDEVPSSLLSYAVIAGYAAQVKISGAAIAFLAFIGGILAVRLRSDYKVHNSKLLEQVSWFCLGLLILASPWYIRSWWFMMDGQFSSSVASGTNDIVHLPTPESAFQSVFNTDMPFIYRHEMLLNRFGMGHDVFSLLTLPWNVTIHCHIHDSTTSLMYFDGQISFIQLAMAPAILFYCFNGKSKFWFRFVCVIVLATGAAWGLGTQQIRFLMPILATSAILVGIVASSDKKHTLLTAAVLLTAFPHSISFSLNRNARIAAYTRGEISQEAFLKQQLPFMGAYQFINESTPKSARILPLFEERVYYLKRPFTWMPLVPYQFISAFLAAKDAFQVKTYLKALEIDYLYLPNVGYRFLLQIFDDAKYKRNLKEFFHSQVKRVYTDSFGEVWEVN